MSLREPPPPCVRVCVRVFDIGQTRVSKASQQKETVSSRGPHNNVPESALEEHALLRLEVHIFNRLLKTLDKKPPNDLPLLLGFCNT